jgi:hypothetical protein
MSEMRKGEPAGSPFHFCCVVSEKPLSSVPIAGDAHRKSGAISFCFAPSPVESCSPPELFELTVVFLRLLKKTRKRKDGESHRI